MIPSSQYCQNLVYRHWARYHRSVINACMCGLFVQTARADSVRGCQKRWWVGNIGLSEHLRGDRVEC
jgi:hypothetical protein